MGYPREAHKMLTRSAVPRLSHVLKSVPKDDTSKPWMEEVDNEHLSTWIDCVGISTMYSEMTLHARQHLATSLDLPPQLGGVGLQSLMRAAYEELLGSRATVTADLISFFRSKCVSVYNQLEDALDAIADEDGDPTSPIVPAVASLLAICKRAYIFLRTSPKQN